MTTHMGNLVACYWPLPIFYRLYRGFRHVDFNIFDMPERAGHVIVFTSIPLFYFQEQHTTRRNACLQYLGNVLPSTQGIQMFIQLNQMGVPTTLILPKLLYLFVFGIACAAFAYWRLKHRKFLERIDNNPTHLIR